MAVRRKKPLKCAAVITIRDAHKMTKKGRREIALWLKHQGTMLKMEGEHYGPTFRGRYLY